MPLENADALEGMSSEFLMLRISGNAHALSGIRRQRVGTSPRTMLLYSFEANGEMEREHATRWGVITLLLIGAGAILCAGPRAAGARHDAGAVPIESLQPLAIQTDTTTTLQLALNIPSFRLDVFEHGELLRSYPVATGMPRYRTPVGSFRIDYVVWNPWWRPPESEWARKERPQPPGWKNPVGRVKMHVHELVFLHGSPFESSMGSAASHACIRMLNADAIALGKLVHSHAGPELSSAVLDSLVVDTARTRHMALTRAVPIHVRYELAEIQGSIVTLYRDVYQFGGTRVPDGRASVMHALAGQGVDTTRVDTVRLRALVRAARRATVRIRIDSLLLAARIER
jgi:hypothetical protein